MKIIFNLLFVLISFAGFGQKIIPNPCPVNSETKLITYTNTVEVPGATKKELYTRALAWCNKHYNQYQWVMDYSNAENDQITGQPFITVIYQPENTKFYLQHSISLNFKDGTYRYEFSNFKFLKGNYKIQQKRVEPKKLQPAEDLFTPGKIVFQSVNIEKFMRQDLDRQLKAYINDLETSMKKQIW